MRSMGRLNETLARAPGLVAGRVCFVAKLDTIVGGSPIPTRFALLCGWESGEARDEFLSDTPRLRPLLGAARESWAVSLETVRVVQGEWHGWQPSIEGVESLARDEPVMVMTYGLLRPRYLPAFTRDNVKAVRQAAVNPGLEMMIGLGDHPLARCTFSLWRSQGDLVRYAYGTGEHNPIQRRSLEAPWARNYFFARFRPLSSSGTWGGRDPLAELRKGTAAPVPA